MGAAGVSSPGAGLLLWEEQVWCYRSKHVFYGSSIVAMVEPGTPYGIAELCVLPI